MSVTTSTSSVHRLLEQAIEVKVVWPEPLPLYRDPEAPEPFPLEALGVLQGMTQETLRIVQAPDALVAASYLASASLAVQGLADLTVDGRVYPLSLYFLTIAESGERKTAVDAIATAPIRERQKELHLAQHSALAHWEVLYAAWEADKRSILAAKKQSRSQRETALKELGPPPAKPWAGIMITTEPTYEGLVKLLADGWPSVGLFSNEGGSFLGGHAMSKDYRLRTIAGLSEVWDGSAIDRVRAGDGASLLFNRRLALHLMAQPEVARKLLGDALAQGQGILARMLTAAPTSTAGTRRYVAESVKDTPEYQRYAGRISNLLKQVEAEVLNAESKHKGPNLRRVPLAPDAKSLWIRYYEHVEAHLNGELAPIRAFSSKAAEHALRLAGVLALAESPQIDKIGKSHLEAGIALAQHYASEAHRLTGGYRIPRELALAGETLAWILTRTKGRQPRTLHLAELYQLGPAGVRSARAALGVLRVLESHHYLGHRPDGTVEGVKHRDVWEVWPHAPT